MDQKPAVLAPIKKIFFVLSATILFITALKLNTITLNQRLINLLYKTSLSKHYTRELSELSESSVPNYTDTKSSAF